MRHSAEDMDCTNSASPPPVTETLRATSMTRGNLNSASNAPAVESEKNQGVPGLKRIAVAMRVDARQNAASVHSERNHVGTIRDVCYVCLPAIAKGQVMNPHGPGQQAQNKFVLGKWTTYVGSMAGT